MPFLIKNELLHTRRLSKLKKPYKIEVLLLNLVLHESRFVFKKYRFTLLGHPPRRQEYAFYIQIRSLYS